MVNTVIFQEDMTHIGFIKFEETAEKKCFQQRILNFLIQQSALFISKSMTEEKSILTIVKRSIYQRRTIINVHITSFTKNY